jgi:hypothetical protein
MNFLDVRPILVPAYSELLISRVLDQRHASGDCMSAIQLSADQSGQVRLSLIIPTLNEAHNLGHVLPALPDMVDELVIVDGGSTCAT